MRCAQSPEARAVRGTDDRDDYLIGAEDDRDLKHARGGRRAGLDGILQLAIAEVVDHSSVGLLDLCAPPHYEFELVVRDSPLCAAEGSVRGQNSWGHHFCISSSRAKVVGLEDAADGLCWM